MRWLLHTIDECCIMAVMNRIDRRKIATEFVEKINTKTCCAHCGEQPVEWHNPDHVEKPNSRVSSLRTQGASVERIQMEMDSCIPLCRICHMIEDGRLDSLRKSQPYQLGEIYVPPLPCSCCFRLSKPLRRKMCTGCYNHQMNIRPRKMQNGCGCDVH